MGSIVSVPQVGGLHPTATSDRLPEKAKIHRAMLHLLGPSKFAPKLFSGVVHIGEFCSSDPTHSRNPVESSIRFEDKTSAMGCMEFSGSIPSTGEFRPCHNVTQPHGILLILKSVGVFGSHTMATKDVAHRLIGQSMA